MIVTKNTLTFVLFVVNFAQIFCKFTNSKLKEGQKNLLERSNGENLPVDVHVCPKICFCRPEISREHALNRKISWSDSGAEDIIDQYNWTATCNRGNIANLGPGTGALSLRQLPWTTVELSLRHNKLKVLYKRTFSALPNLKILDLSYNEITILGSDVFVDLKQLIILVRENHETSDACAKLALNTALHIDANCLYISRQSVMQMEDTLTSRMILEFSAYFILVQFKPESFEIEPADDTRLVFPGDSLILTCRVSSKESGQNVSLEWLHDDKAVKWDSNRVLTEKYSNGPGRGGGSNLEAKVEFKRISPEDKGDWRCRAETTSVGLAMKTIKLMVLDINSSSKHFSADLKCEEEFTVDLKGNFSWPATSIGHIAKLDCPFGYTKTPCNSDNLCFASRLCKPSGEWKNTWNNSVCDFKSGIIRAVRREFLTNSTKFQSRITYWKRFENLTKNISSQKEGWTVESGAELDFLVKILEKGRQAGRETEVRAVSNILTGISEDIFRQGEREFNVSTRLRAWISGFAPDSLTANVLAGENLGICENTVRKGEENRDGTPIEGYFAAAYEKQSVRGRNFICSKFAEGRGRIGTRFSLSSVEFPEVLARNVTSVKFENMPVYLSLAWMRNSLFFVDLWQQQEEEDDRWVSESQVLGVKVEKLFARLGFITVGRQKNRKERSADEGEQAEMDFLARNETGIEGSNATDPDLWVEVEKPKEKWVKFYFTVAERTSDIRLGFWNESGKFWTPVAKETCVSMGGDAAVVVRIGFLCSEQLVKGILRDLVNGGKSGNNESGIVPPGSSTSVYGFFTAIQKWNELAKTREAKEPIKLLPWMYAGCGVLSICLLAAVFSYCCCSRRIRMSLKLRHCLVNCWLSITALCLTFTLGIDQVWFEQLCLVVSITLHYLFLVSLLWTVVTLRTVQRKLWKLANPPQVSEDEGPPGEVPRHGPLVGLYFLAWGLPVMPTAFSMSLKLTEYTGSGAYCFLRPGGLFCGAVLLPAGIILSVALILMISAWCSVSKAAQNSPGGSRVSAANKEERKLDESAQLLVHQQQNGIVRHAAQESDLASVVSSAIDADLKNANSLQLRWAVSVVLLYVAVCVVAAAYVGRPAIIFARIRYFAEITGGVYTALVVALSLVIFFSYVICRPALREGWYKCGRGSGPPTAGRNDRTRRPTRTKRDVGVAMTNGTGQERRRSTDPSRSRTPASEKGANSQIGGGSSFVLQPESEKYMKAMVKKYHSKQRQAKMEGESNDAQVCAYGMNGSAILPSDLASEVILEEDELNYVPSPVDSHKDWNVPPNSRNQSQRSKEASRLLKDVKNFEESQQLLLTSTLSDPLPGKSTTVSSGCLAQERMTKSDGYHDYVNVNELSPVNLRQKQESPRKRSKTREQVLPNGGGSPPVEETVKMRTKRGSVDVGSESSKSSRHHSETTV